MIITPKYDGCSFEAVLYPIGTAKSISTRGDGNHGLDISKHLEKQIKSVNLINLSNYDMCVRGEVLIKRSVFNEKYSDNFTNPRSFVSGLLKRKYEDIEDKDILNDLDIVVYEVRIKKNGIWEDSDWCKYTTQIKVLPEYSANIRWEDFHINMIYQLFDEYRRGCEYVLDGFVIKPTEEYRENNLTEERPKDCVAIKFLPMIHETTVNHIEWQLGKNGEYTPVVVYDTFKLDGKDMTRATAFNYGFVKRNNICKGTRIKVSLAGDIIPSIYEVVSSPSETVEIETPPNTYIEGCHLMKELTGTEKARIDFLASIKTLKIRGLGEKQGEFIFDTLLTIEKNDIRYHVFELTERDFYFLYIDKIGNLMKSGENLLNAWKRRKETATLAEIIQSCNFTDCGESTAKQIEKFLIEKNKGTILPTYDFSGLSRVSYEWVYDEYSKEMTYLKALLRHINNVSSGFEFDKYIDSFVEEPLNTEVIKVILTGSPTQYKTKKEFLSAHPEFVETTKWNECQILFCGDLNSTSSKMTKAKKLGIEIKEY